MSASEGTKTTPAYQIPDQQWELPIVYSIDGRTHLSLRSCVKEGAAQMPPASLSDEQWRSLVVARIAKLPDFKMVSMKEGVIDGQRALREIAADSSLGRALIEVERILIENLLQQAKQQQG